MRIPIILWHFEKLSLSSGSSWAGSWTPTDDYIIRYILIRRGDGSAWTKSKVTFLLENKAITRDSAPVAIFGVDMYNALPINVEINANEKLEWTLTNFEGAGVDVYMTFVLEPKTPITS